MVNAEDKLTFFVVDLLHADKIVQCIAIAAIFYGQCIFMIGGVTYAIANPEPFLYTLITTGFTDRCYNRRIGTDDSGFVLGKQTV
jgi:hypothetical protein